jgi:hypothetical protein
MINKQLLKGYAQVFWDVLCHWVSGYPYFKDQRVKQLQAVVIVRLFFLYGLTAENKSITVLHNLATTYPMIQLYISQDLNSQLHCCENLRFHMLSSVQMNIQCKKSRSKVMITAGTIPSHILSLFPHTTFLTTGEGKMSLTLVFGHPSHKYTINLLPHSAQKVSIP